MKIEAGRKCKAIVEVQLGHTKNYIVLKAEYTFRVFEDYPSRKALTEDFLADWFKENQHKYTNYRTHKMIRKEDVKVTII